ncbi:LUD domain-containing protein [bacterium]|nr:LUD domain-containing protein [bacterium]RQV95501.1 MAG: hypothetical protein EH221_05880 [bacterium]
MDASRYKILEKIKAGTRIHSQIPSATDDFEKQIIDGLEAITPKGNQALVDQFKNELELVSGEFHLIRNDDEAAEWISQYLTKNKVNKWVISGETRCQQIADRIHQKMGGIELVETTQIGWPKRKTELADASVALVEASFAIADIGSLVFRCDQTRTSLPHFLSDCVIAIVEQKRLLANQHELFQKLSSEEMKHLFMMAGPSRTADIEKILILGVHGPRQVIVLMLAS